MLLPTVQLSLTVHLSNPSDCYPTAFEYTKENNMYGFVVTLAPRGSG